MKTISIFSGCGGSDIGAADAGAEIIFAIDKDKNAVDTYRRYIDRIGASDEAIVHGDIADVVEFPDADLLLGSYPCQSFTMGGNRDPESHRDASLYLEFHRVLGIAQPKYFIAENVSGLKWLNSGEYLDTHIEVFKRVGEGYNVSVATLNAKDYGVPADRKRVIFVGVRSDLDQQYAFPEPTHGGPESELTTWNGHGDVIAHLPSSPVGEYYHYEKEPFSWWYMSRNRKRNWHEPSYAITANWRHIPLHPSSPGMVLTESNLEDRSRQTWEFRTPEPSSEKSGNRNVLDEPRRLSWRECALLQTFPADFDPSGSVQQKFTQIGNAVPPVLMEQIVAGLVNESALAPVEVNFGLGETSSMLPEN